MFFVLLLVFFAGKLYGVDPIEVVSSKVVTVKPKRAERIQPVEYSALLLAAPSPVSPVYSVDLSAHHTSSPSSPSQQQETSVVSKERGCPFCQIL